MTRTRRFDPALALDRAVELFWMRGYGDTSLDDLVRGTGVSRYGLYGTFGDKRDLFRKALGRYRERVIAPLVAELERPGAGSAELQRFFTRLAAWLSGPQGRRGCLMCNTAVELGADDPASMRAVSAHFRRLRDAMARVLQTAKRRGELSADAEPRRDANLLLGVVQGAFVLIRGGQDPKAVQELLRTALRTVAGPRPTLSPHRATRARRTPSAS